MSYWRSKVAAACLYVAGVALLIPGCDQLGLGGAGGTGGADPLGGAPCQNSCNADYDAAANECVAITDDAERAACQSGAYAEVEQCLRVCDNANADCDDKYEQCREKGGAACRKRSGGQTQCYRCWERCRAGDSPSSTCSKCYF